MLSHGHGQQVSHAFDPVSAYAIWTVKRPEQHLYRSTQNIASSLKFDPLKVTKVLMERQNWGTDCVYQCLNAIARFLVGDTETWQLLG